MELQRQVLTQGERFASAEPGLEVSTLLGSCVSCCLWDHEVCVGGINHMLLTRSLAVGGRHDLNGVAEMELLVNAMLALGAERRRLVAKVFGGARMVDGLSEIGAENVAFTLRYLEAEGIEVLGKSVGGTSARHLLFRPATGVARQKLVQEVVVEAPQPVQGSLADGNGVELL